MATSGVAVTVRRPDRDRSLAGLLHGRQHRDPLDGARRDPRGRGRRARRRDAAARPHAAVRPSRLHARPRLHLFALAARNRSHRRPGSTRPGAEGAGFWQRWTDARDAPSGALGGARPRVLLALAAPGARAAAPRTARCASSRRPRDAGRLRGRRRRSPGSGAGVGGEGASRPRAEAAARRPRAALAADPDIAHVAAAGARRATAAPCCCVASRAPTASPPPPRRPSRRAARRRCRARQRRRRRRHGRAAATSTSSSAARCGRSCCSSSAFSYIVLLVLLRSVVLPAKAVLMNLLSVGAAFGVLTLVFGDGRHAHAAARARGRVRPLDGLRGVPAHAHPRALRRRPATRAWPSRRGSPRARARSARRR